MVFIFVNEALSVILRSVHSVVNHTPAHLLKEIILVDDNSDSGKNSVCLREEKDVIVWGWTPGLLDVSFVHFNELLQTSTLSPSPAVRLLFHTDAPFVIVCLP